VTDRLSAADPAGLRAVGVSLGHRDLAAADHWILSLDPRPVMACTHLVRSPFPHVAISLTGVGADLDLPPMPDLTDGRAVVYPGVRTLTGSLTVAAVLSESAIDRIEILGGGAPAPSTILDTNDFVRPQWRAGELILTTMPAAGDRLVPFESRHPTPCCATH
jgi:hypothetical protein